MEPFSFAFIFNFCLYFIQQLQVLLTEPGGFQHIGTAQESSLQRLAPAPFGDIGMVARQEDFGDSPVPKSQACTGDIQ